jgi:S1-C subfamily serine protease
MNFSRRAILGVISVVPLVAQPSWAQNAQPQVAAQSTATQAAIPQSEGESAAWRGTLARVAESVVAIELDQTRAFDTEWNSSAQATGFVVDAERGLILTNRHVVTPGPVTSEATFLNREEVQLFPVYRDPIHDFGIYRYDPKKLRFIKPRSLPLYPDGAQIGREIRVIGNSSIATRPSTASASTTTSTPSTCRPRPGPRAVPRARRSSTSRAGSSRSTPAAPPAQPRASIYRWAA